MNEKKHSPFFIFLAISLVLTPVLFLPVLHSFILPRQTFVIVAIVCLAAMAALGRRRSLRVSAYAVPWVLFNAISFASIFSAPSILTGLKTFCFFFALTSLAVFISLVPGLRKHFRLILGAIVVPGLFNALYAISQMCGADFDAMKTRFHAMGALGSPGLLGGYLSICAIITFHFFVHSRRSATAIIHLALSIALAAVAAMTLSRTSLISMGAGLFVYAVLTVFQWRQNKKWAALCMAGVFVIATISSIIVLPSTGLYNRLAKSDRPLSAYFSSRYKSDSALQRRLIWKSAIEIIKEHPLTGAGAGSFYFQYPPAQAKVMKGRDFRGSFARVATDRVASYAHNDYLQLASELGLPGLVAFLMFPIFAFIYMFRSMSIRHPFVLEYFPILVAAPATIMAQSFFDFPMYMPASALIFWLFTGVCAKKTPCSDDENSPSKSAFVRMAVIGGAVVLIVAACLPLASAVALAKADDSLAAGDFAAADEQLSIAAKLDPSEPEIYALRGRLERMRRNFRKSVEYYEQALNTSNHPGHIYGKGMSEFLAGDIDAAENSFLSVLSIDPRSSEALSAMGIIWLQKGETDRAAEAFAKAREIDPLNRVASQYAIPTRSGGGNVSK